MKTVKEWLTELPEPYKTKALNNLNSEVENTLRENQNIAITAAFDWGNSKEGFEYWWQLAKTL